MLDDGIIATFSEFHSSLGEMIYSPNMVLPLKKIYLNLESDSRIWIE